MSILTSFDEKGRRSAKEYQSQSKPNKASNYYAGVHSSSNTANNFCSISRSPRAVKTSTHSKRLISRRGIGKGPGWTNIQTYIAEEQQANAVDNQKLDRAWYLDSGCTQHMTNQVSGAIGTHSSVSNTAGEAVIMSKHSPVKLQNVLYVPNLAKNL